VLGSLLLLVGVLLALLLEDWRISLALSVYAVVALFILARMQGIAEPYWKAAREASAALFGFLEEQLAGTEDTRASGATPYVMRNLFRFGRDRLKAERQAGVASTYMVMTWLGLFTVGQLIAYTTGYYLHQDGLLTIGAVYLIVFYTDAIYRPLEQITEQIQNLQKAGASIGRVQELYHTPIRILDGEHTLPDGALGVSFEQVRFSYEQSHAAYRSEQPNHEDTKAQRHQGRENGVSDDTADLLSGQLVTVSPDHPVAQSHDHAITQSDNHPITQSDNHPITQSDNHPITQSPAHKLVLDGVSFALAPGEVLGLLGRTGSGKTTVTRLLFRLYEPQGGAIRLNTTGDSVELRETMLDDLRHKVGMVTQDVQLFRASVRDNLTFFDRTITDEQIVAALAQLGLGEWFNDLSDGLDTQLTSGAAGLSAGEAQLLAFTRVFLKNPGLVIMDEASSRLDPATEARIERAIDKLLAGRTGIIVAHRLATVHRADKILILEAGKVREFGIYSELVADPASRFAELLRTGEMQEVLAA
jgi:ABC-type multidrug transport system fused ATPase/permease subunit